MNHSYQKENIALATLFMLCAQLFSASTVTAVKIVSKTISTPIIVFISYLICLCFISMILLIKKNIGIKTKHLPLQIIRGVTGVLYFGGLFYAVKFIPVVDGILLRSTAPMWVPLITFMWMKERINHKLWWGMGIGFVGIILVLHPTLVGLNRGYFIALFAAVIFALSSIITNKLNQLGEPLYRTLFYAFLVPTVFLAPYACFHWPNNFNYTNIILLFIIGTLTLPLLLFYVMALKHAKATVVLPLTYVGVVFAGIYGWIFWQHTPNMISIAGMVFVFLGCIFIINQRAKELI